MNTTTPQRPSSSLRTRVARTAVLAAFAALAAFWTWALFFASKESINRIDDRAWAADAEAICASAASSREALADYRRVDPSDPDSLRERAAVVDRATGILEEMVAGLAARRPTDAKGAEIVPLWLADYRDYLGDRRAHAELLRSGSNDPFRETKVDNLPISERITTFAVDNEMPSCAPPTDL